MTVTGSVPEDRVFGTYGPSDPQRVLATLLDGTGSNFLIRSNATDAPLQLVLTPRQGAASPPDPNAGRGQDGDDSQDDVGVTPPIAAPRQQQPGVPSSYPQPTPSAGGISGNPATNPAAGQPSSTSEEVVFQPIGASATPAVGSTTTVPSTTGTAPSNSSDGIKTPQEIFEQLQKLRQQRSGAPQ